MKPIIWVVAACLAAGVQAAEILGEEVEKISRVEDLVRILESTQRFLQGISPPSSEIHVAREKVPLPVDWSGFDKKTTRYMTATMDEYGLPRYGLLLWEDVATRERVVALSSTGYEIVRIPAPEDYQPEAYYTAMLSGGGTYSETMRWIFDPAHTAVEIELIPETLYSAYEQYEAEKVAQQELLAAREAVPVPAEESDSIRVGISLVPVDMADTSLEGEDGVAMDMAMMSMPPPPPDGGDVGSSTNGGGPSNLVVELGIQLPEGFCDGYIGVFAKDDLVYSPGWSPLDDWVPTFGEQTVYYLDPESSNKTQRFYLITGADDPDGDGRSSFLEELLGSDPDTYEHFDTDSDDIHDWWEERLFGSLSYDGGDDPDGDGIATSNELLFAQPPVMITDPSLYSSDGDILGDAEMFASPPTDPWNPDASPPSASILWPTNNAVVAF